MTRAMGEMQKGQRSHKNTGPAEMSMVEGTGERPPGRGHGDGTDKHQQAHRGGEEETGKQNPTYVRDFRPSMTADKDCPQISRKTSCVYQLGSPVLSEVCRDSHSSRPFCLY